MMMSINRRRFLASSGAALLASGGSAQDYAALHVCPKSKPPARTLYGYRLDELTSQAADMRLTLHCLQGIVNRSTPRLYLVQDRYDELWLDWMRERGDIDHVRWLELGDLFGQFLPEVSCMFVTDPAIPATVNVATMLAAVHNGLVATPANAAQFNVPAGAYPDSSKVGMDLRRMNWRKDIDAYRWAFGSVGAKLSREAFAMLDPATSALRDYLVEFRIPVMWVSGPADAVRNPQAAFEEELRFARETLMQWPANIPCVGWPGNGVGPESGIGEWEGVRLASECGKFQICSGYDGYSATVSNTSVHSGTTATFRQKPAPVKLRRDRVYVAFTRSDGDGWNFQRHYYRKLFDDPPHGATPIGWQIGPTAADANPDILDYFYRHAKSGDYFVNALSGVGYIHEDNYAENYGDAEREQIWQEFIRLSAVYRERIDANVISTFAEMAPERLARIAGISGIEGVFANYGRTRLTTPENLVTAIGGKPVFRSVNRPPGGLAFTPSTRRDAEVFMIAETRRWTPQTRPAFLHVFLANWLTHLEMAQNIAQGLGPEYVFVRPDQLVSLWQQNH